MSTLWLCTMMDRLAEKHNPKDPRGKAFKASWRWASKWANENNITKRKRSNSKNQSIEECLPKIRRFQTNLRR